MVQLAKPEASQVPNLRIVDGTRPIRILYLYLNLNLNLNPIYSLNYGFRVLKKILDGRVVPISCSSTP